MKAPTARSSSVSVMAQVIGVTSVPNVSATFAEHEDQDEEVEGVERPAKIAGGDDVLRLASNVGHDHSSPMSKKREG